MKKMKRKSTKFKSKLLATSLAVSLLLSMSATAFAEVETVEDEPDWNEAGLRLQGYMDEYADDPSMTEFLEYFEELYMDELVGENPDILSQEEFNKITGVSYELELPPVSSWIMPLAVDLTKGDPYRCGDLTGDGKIGMADLLQINRHIVSLQPNNPQNDIKALRAGLICRHTGQIEMSDYLQVNRAIVKLTSKLDSCDGNSNTNTLSGVSCTTSTSDGGPGTAYNTYAVWFNGNGGSTPKSRIVRSGYHMEYDNDLNSSTRDRFVFQYWTYSNGARVYGSDPVTSSVTLYAQWTATPHPTLANSPKGPYNTVDAAALAWANYVYRTSLFVMHEHSAVIYKMSDSANVFYLTPSHSGYQHGTGLPTPPDGTIRVATIHTHPGGSSDFSGTISGDKEDKGDIPNAIRRGLDSYVVARTSNGADTYRLRKFTFSTLQKSTVGTVTLRSMTSSERTALTNYYRTSWNNHIPDCKQLNKCTTSTPWPKTQY
ncbi:MAG: hypothetical protein FWG45_04365 [Oscillospiraceae bacterium]|nr:hypothetical protein [Oscillospiraceae bacterium]